ncbi:MAG: hypothetical protein NVV60_00545 [Luteimonas sp.]|nr:hypothetical protein [Luteimonas sp.]
MKGNIVTMALACLTVAVALGCYDQRDDDNGAGFRDGFVSGYGKACTLHAPQIQAQWHDAGYTRAYADGMAIGIKACDNERSVDATIEYQDEAVTRVAAR